MAESTLSQLRKIRLEKIEKLKGLGIDPYPAKSQKDNSNKEIVDGYEKFEGKEVTLTGRLMSWREHGHLIFGQLQDDTAPIQLYIKDDQLEETSKEKQILGFKDLNLLDVGDFLQVTGTITKTQRGEISILPKQIKFLAKAIRPLPEKWHGMTDKEERFRRRYLDMTMNPEVRERFKRRAEFWQAHRDFFNDKGFYEINIPVLEHVPGGGDAVPFTTHMNAIDQDFFLRISHELPLKRLIGGGFEKVYDIGARFRNEGLSDEHLPEHVAMEFYWAYADWKDGMKLIQELYKYIIEKVYKGQTKFKIREFEVDFSKEWEEIDFNEIMKGKYGIKDVYKVTLEEIKELLTKNGIKFDRSVNVARGVDALWKRLRKTITGPAFLVNHPKYLSPLQKPSLENVDMVERFQPIIAGSELGNGWSEVNDAVDQYDRFIEQQKLRDAGDAEAQWLDIDYVEMLEYGMPPTFGYGHSERVFWFLEDVTAREGVPFPQLKHELDEITKELYPELKELAGTDAKVEGTEKKQDFDKKLVIVVNKDLPEWQALNTVEHVAAYIGNKLGENFATGDNFVTKDGKNHPRNSQYAIVTLAGKPGQLQNFMESVRNSGLEFHGFIREMIETTDDAEIVKILSEKEDKDIEYLGVGVFGPRDKVDALTKKFSLWK